MSTIPHEFDNVRIQMSLGQVNLPSVGIANGIKGNIIDHMGYLLRSVAHMSPKGCEDITSQFRTKSYVVGIDTYFRDKESAHRFFEYFLANIRDLVHEGSHLRQDGTRLIEGDENYTRYLDRGAVSMHFTDSSTGAVWEWFSNRATKKSSYSHDVSNETPEAAQPDTELLRSIREEYQALLKRETEHHQAMLEHQRAIEDTLLAKVDQLTEENARLRALTSRHARSVRRNRSSCKKCANGSK